MRSVIEFHNYIDLRKVFIDSILNAGILAIVSESKPQTRSRVPRKTGMDETESGK